MALEWKLEYNGVTKTFEDWGIFNVNRQRFSLAVDTLSFEVRAEFDAGDIFPVDALIKVYQPDGTQWFYGRVDKTPRTASGKYEGHAYVIVGPWFDIEDLVFQAHWRQLVDATDPSQGFTTQLRSHVILNMDLAGRSIYSTKAQIQTALDYVLFSASETGQPISFQIGSLELPNVFPWLDDVVDQKCSDVIRRQLKLTPDTVGYFDYSTSPPTFHIKQRSALTSKEVEFGGEDAIAFEISPRPDIQVSEVVIKYESVNVVNGIAYPMLEVDTAPPGATGQKRRSIVQTINLQGSQISYSQADIVCADLSPADADWWKQQYRPLAQDNIVDVAIAEFTRSTELPRYLVSGNVTGWMLSRNNASATRELIEAKASWSVKESAESDVITDKVVEKPISTELTATDLTTGRYTSSLSAILAEPTPIGLANYIWQATKFLHYDGQITLSEEECTSRIGIGDAVNITGAKTEFATMNAIVQSVIENIDSGRTTIVVGPPKHLGIDDIIEYLRGNRNRRPTTPVSTGTEGESFSATPIDIGKETPMKNSNADNAKLDKFTVAQNLIIDRADNPSSREVRLREVTYCDNGTEKHMLIWASAPY